MGRVGDDHISHRNYFYHSPARHLILHALDLALDLRVSFGFLTLVLDLLLRHLEIFNIAPLDVHHIKDAKNNQDSAGMGNDFEGDMANKAENGLDVGFRQKSDVLHFITDDAIGNPGHHQQLQQGFDHLHQGIFVEQPLESAHRTDLAKVNGQSRHTEFQLAAVLNHA